MLLEVSLLLQKIVYNYINYIYVFNHYSTTLNIFYDHILSTNKYFRSPYKKILTLSGLRYKNKISTKLLIE